MNCPGICKPLVRNPLLLLFFVLIPSFALSQIEFVNSKNAWHKDSRGLQLKKMGIYSSYENIFFLKKAQKKPATKENWVIFGGEGGEFSIRRDSSFAYTEGKMIFGQKEIFIASEVGTDTKWHLMSNSDTLYLDIEAQEGTNIGFCRLFRTFQFADTARDSQQVKEIELMRVEADNQSLKRLNMEDLTPGDERFIPFKIMAIFIYAHTLGRDSY